ncbi:hypothetical protein D3C71_2002270 [compost metagenome]
MPHRAAIEIMTPCQNRSGVYDAREVRADGLQLSDSALSVLQNGSQAYTGVRPQPVTAKLPPTEQQPSIQQGGDRSVYFTRRRRR